MTEIMPLLIIVLLLLQMVALGLLWLLKGRVQPIDIAPLEQRLITLEQSLLKLEHSQEKLERALVEPLSLQRQESADAARQLREEVTRSIKDLGEASLQGLREISKGQKDQLESFAHRLSQLNATTEQKLSELRTSSENTLTQSRSATEQKLSELRQSSESTLARLGQSMEQKIETLRTTVENRLTQIQQDNALKLEQMRQTVDEKLQGTLEKRLGESFKQVSERLEQVHKGLGEMQSLATGVGDLKKVIVNIKTRGTWGEWQLGSLLEQMLAPEQYAQNVATKPGSSERVEFVIKLPGRSLDAAGGDQPVLLPIDAKFPQEDYQRLIEAADRADPAGVEEATKQLENRIKGMARDIHDKYIAEPYTTNFAILYLPTEGLYAEVARRPGLLEVLQRDYRVSVAGPTTLAAQINALQMGFRTLAIQKRSAEVWEVLGVVKTEFGKFAEVLANVKTKLEQATNTIEKAETRTRAIERKLKDVQALPAAEQAQQGLLEAPAASEDND